MLAKRKQTKFFFIAYSVILITAVSALTFNKEKLTMFFFDTLETFNSYDLGYSSLKSFIGVDSLSQLGSSNSEIITQTSIKVFKVAFPKLIKVTKFKLFDDFSRPPIESLDVNISFKNYQKILDDRRQGLQNGILINPQTVNGEIIFRGETYKAEIRLKGDLLDHWRSSLRMSLRISLKNGKTILGMRRFSIHSPGSRQFPHEQAYQTTLKALNGVAVPHDLLSVRVNGTSWGVMNVEEHMSKEFLEKQGLKESIIFKFGDEKLWQYQKKATYDYDNYLLSVPKLYSSIYQSNKYLINNIYRAQFSYILESYLNEKIENILDKESTMNAIILSGIWNNQHALNFANSRFYLNPYDLKLRTITTDQGPVYEIDKAFKFINNLDGFYPEFLKNITKNDFNESMDSFKNINKKIESSYKDLQSYFPIDEPVNLELIDANLAKVINYDFDEFKSTLSSAKNDSPILAPSKTQIEEMPEHIYVRHYENGEVHLYNLLPVDVNIKRITLLSNPNNEVEFQNLVLPSYEKQNNLVISSPFKGIHDFNILVDSSIGDVLRSSVNNYTLINDIQNPLLNISRVLPEYITQIDHKQYLIKSGSWYVSEPLILDGKVNIESGTELIFAKDSYLIIKGSIFAKGVDNQRIIFRPQNETWKGLYVLGDNNKSLLEHVSFLSTNELRDGILQLTGGVTFFNSQVSIFNTSFFNASGEDALNIVNSNFNIKSIVINGTFSDGLDFDYSNGEMLISEFYNIGGDAVDVSGGKVEFEGLSIEKVRDKGVSAGEGSNVFIISSEIKDVGVGIASKDGSHVEAINNSIINSGLYDLMTYTKKDFFSFSSLNYLSKKDESITSLRQVNTKLEINNLIMPEVILDVDSLYQTEIMSK